MVKLKLFASLRAMLPAGSNGEEVELDLPEGTTAQDIIARLEIPESLAHLVMINGYHLLPKEVRERPLQDGEVLSIFPPIAGG